MNVQKIENLENFLLLPKEHKIIDQKIKRLTAAGDNYGSLMLKLDVTVETPNGTEEIHTVAKLVPPNEFLQTVFNTQATYRNEVAFYKTIVPTLQQFQREHGIENIIDFTAKYYGSRLNLEDDVSARVDANAALVLENLKLKNFENVDRLVGFDLDQAKMILFDLAHLHAVPLALKIQNKELFDKNIKPYLTPFKHDEKFAEQGSENLRQRIQSFEEIKEYADRATIVFKKMLTPLKVREPWSTITHDDSWVNNIMLKIEEGKAIKSKLVDFQICDYGSPARDVVFFLFTSVQNHVMEEHYDELVKFYHQIFVKILKELGCDSTEFSFEAFEKEIDLEARNSQFGHVAFMLEPIFAPKGSVQELDELSLDTLSSPVSEPYKNKLIFFVKQFVKRNWI